MAVEVIEVSTEKAIRVFNSFPRVIYRNFYTAPSFPVIDRSNPRYDPLFAAVKAMPFLAVKNGRVAGRIAAGVHQNIPGGKTGFFGYFESQNDQAVAKALIRAAACWLAARGINEMIGPVDLSPHERLGLLVEGFGERCFPGMPYNPPYYSSLLADCGLDEEIDLFAYQCDLRRPLPGKMFRAEARARRIRGLRLRGVNFDDPDGEGEIFSIIHNNSMNELWGFVPLLPEEGSAIWRKLRDCCDPSLILFAEISGNPAGMCLLLHIVKKTPFPGLPGRSRARLAVLAVLPQYRFKGLEAALLLECARRARSKGISNVEISLVAESNLMMGRIIKSMTSVCKDRVYRVYKMQDCLSEIIT